MYMQKFQDKGIQDGQAIRTFCVKSRSSRLKSDGGSGREMEVSHRGGPEVQRRYESGELSKDLA